MNNPWNLFFSFFHARVAMHMAKSVNLWLAWHTSHADRISHPRTAPRCPRDPAFQYQPDAKDPPWRILQILNVQKCSVGISHTMIVPQWLCHKVRGIRLLRDSLMQGILQDRSCKLRICQCNRSRITAFSDKGCLLSCTQHFLIIACRYACIYCVLKRIPPVMHRAFVSKMFSCPAYSICVPHTASSGAQQMVACHAYTMSWKRIPSAMHPAFSCKMFPFHAYNTCVPNTATSGAHCIFLQIFACHAYPTSCSA